VKHARRDRAYRHEWWRGRRRSDRRSPPIHNRVRRSYGNSPGRRALRLDGRIRFDATFRREPSLPPGVSSGSSGPVRTDRVYVPYCPPSRADVSQSVHNKARLWHSIAVCAR